MKHLPTMDPEAAASTHIHHPGPLPRHPLTPTEEKPHTLPKLTLQGDAHKRDATLTPSSPAPADRSLGFHPERPSHNRKRESTMMPPRRETTSVDAAIIGTDSRVRAKLSPGRTPLQERAHKARATHR
jgi:hypothetical protein